MYTKYPNQAAVVARAQKISFISMIHFGFSLQIKINVVSDTKFYNKITNFAEIGQQIFFTLFIVLLKMYKNVKKYVCVYWFFLGLK